MEYYQRLSGYYTSLGYAPEQVRYLSTAAYVQAQQLAQRSPQTYEQALIQQFLNLNDGQKMQFVQRWLLQNPQYFMKEKAAAA